MSTVHRKLGDVWDDWEKWGSGSRFVAYLPALVVVWITIMILVAIYAAVWPK